MNAKSSWHHEIFHEGVKHSYKILREVFRTRSSLQDICIYELVELGTTLILDSKIQSAEVDEHIYHESLVHPGLLAHDNPRSIFIAGGGEGATLREVLRHRSVERVTMVEIDEVVVEACRMHLSKMHEGSFDDPRLRLRFADARASLQSHDDRYDAIVVDVSDPDDHSPSRMLFTREFYWLCKSRLNPNGVLIVQGDIVGTATTHLFLPIVSTLRAVFQGVFPYWAHVPSFHYPWGFVACFPFDRAGLPYVGDRVVHERLVGELRYYDGLTHTMSTIFNRALRDGLEASSARQLTDSDWDVVEQRTR
jgi:spermidine synthase